jgi:rod shape-determining protein MreD
MPPVAPHRKTPPRVMTPERLLGEAPLWFIAVTLFISWLLNLLPWGSWPGVPDFFAICLVYWGAHAPRRVGVTVAFVGGVLLDVHNAALLGEHALAYTLMVYWAIVLRSRVMRFGPVGQTLHVFPILLVATAAMVLVRSLLELAWPGWWWVVDVVVAAALWPLASWLLQLPQELAAGGENA